MEYRKVEKLEECNWIAVDFPTLKKGDAFRMFEPWGEEVIDNEGKNSWICGSDSYINKDGIWQVDIYRI